MKKAIAKQPSAFLLLHFLFHPGIMSKYGLAGNKIKTETHKQQDGFAGGKEFIQVS